MKQFRNKFKSQKVNYDRISRTINKDGNDVDEIKETCMDKIAKAVFVEILGLYL
jgi:hypothetical protein